MPLGPGSPVVRAPRCGRGNMGSIPARGNEKKVLWMLLERFLKPVMQNMNGSWSRKLLQMILCIYCHDMAHYHSETVTEVELVVQYVSSSFSVVKEV